MVDDDVFPRNTSKRQCYSWRYLHVSKQGVCISLIYSLDRISTLLI